MHCGVPNSISMHSFALSIFESRLLLVSLSPYFLVLLFLSLSHSATLTTKHTIDRDAPDRFKCEQHAHNQPFNACHARKCSRILVQLCLATITARFACAWARQLQMQVERIRIACLLVFALAACLALWSKPKRNEWHEIHTKRLEIVWPTRNGTRRESSPPFVIFNTVPDPAKEIPQPTRSRWQHAIWRKLTRVQANHDDSVDLPGFVPYDEYVPLSNVAYCNQNEKMFFGSVKWPIFFIYSMLYKKDYKRKLVHEYWRDRNASVWYWLSTLEISILSRHICVVG